MLATRVRVSPCSALCRGSSEGRATVTWPSAWLTAISRGRVRRSSPFGPFTAMVAPSTVTATPAGMATGRLPMRDMAASLPDDGDELAAEVGRARLPVGHQALRRGHDRHAEAVLDPRDLAALDVVPEAGLAHPVELADHGQLVVVLQVQSQHPPAPVVQDLVVLDEVVLEEEARELDLELRRRHVHPAVACRAGVPDARQEIRDGISHAHRGRLTSSPCARPGSRPSGPAPGSRCGTGQTSAGSPGCVRTAGSGGRSGRRTSARAWRARSSRSSPWVLSPQASTGGGVSPRNGQPNSRRRAMARSSRPAVVTMVMSIPWTFSTLSKSISGKIICSLTPTV